MRSWIKAGLIGGALLALLTLAGYLSTFVPEDMVAALSCCLCIPQLLIYVGVGVLATHWSIEPITVEEGAKEGALAGLVAGGVQSVVTVIASVVALLTGLTAQQVAQLPPETFEGMGLTPQQLDQLVAGSTLFGTFCGVLFTLLFAIIGGVIGGMIYAAIRGE